MFGGGIGGMEIVIILVVALLVFGPKKLPEMGKAIGSAVTQFKKGISGIEEDNNTPPAQQLNKPAANDPQSEASQDTTNNTAG